MEREDKQGVCEALDSEDTGMGSDLENSEDREGDPEEREMGSRAQDVDRRGGHPEQEMGPNPQDEALREDSAERELVPDICTGEESFQGRHPTYFFLAPPQVSLGQRSCGEAFLALHSCCH